MRRGARHWLTPGFWCLLLSLLAPNLAAQGGKVLTLEQALQAADAAHPEVQIAEAEREMALADQAAVGARRDLSVVAEGRLQRVKPANPGADYVSDNSVRLAARKNLFDFGRAYNAEGAARALVEARDLNLIDTRDQRRIDIMARYFDVLIADHQFIADNEYMAAAYVAFDHARERLEQKLISRVDLAELDARYQAWLIKRNDSQKRQRITRALLALAMNQPGQLVSELEDPRLPGNNPPLPDYEALLPLLENNPKLKASRQSLEASRQRMDANRAETNPSLDAELEANDYGNRKLPGRDAVRAGVVLSWPFYQGSRVSAQLAREQAQFHKLQAEAEKLKRDLQQMLLSAWMDAEQLQKTTRNATRIQADYRDLMLERARGQYEMELKTTLGDTMAATAEAKLHQRAVEYQLALALAKLEALLGQPLPQLAKK